MPPLYRASERPALLLGAAFACGDLQHGLEELAPAAGARLEAAVVQPSVVLQPEPGVVAEEFGRLRRAVGPRHRLALVQQVGEAEAVLRGEALHVLKTVLRIGGGVVGHDRGTADAM